MKIVEHESGRWFDVVDRNGLVVFSSKSERLCRLFVKNPEQFDCSPSCWES